MTKEIRIVSILSENKNGKAALIKYNVFDTEDTELGLLHSGMAFIDDKNFETQNLFVDENFLHNVYYSIVMHNLKMTMETTGTITEFHEEINNMVIRVSEKKGNEELENIAIMIGSSYFRGTAGITEESVTMFYSALKENKIIQWSELTIGFEDIINKRYMAKEKALYNNNSIYNFIVNYVEDKLKVADSFEALHEEFKKEYGIMLIKA